MGFNHTGTRLGDTALLWQDNVNADALSRNPVPTSSNAGVDDDVETEASEAECASNEKSPCQVQRSA